MGDVRSNLFSGDDDLNLSEFTPKKPPRQDQAVAQRAAESAGFRSREPKVVPMPVPEKRVQRRRRTGRNMQLNLKATPETIAAFCAVADSQGWVLGEALEKAVELLEKAYGKGSN